METRPLGIGSILILAFVFGAASAGENPKTESAAIRLRVRVQDGLGAPVPQAKGTLFKATPPSKQRGRSDSPIAIVKENAAPVVNAAGILETAPLPTRSAYVLEVSADGFLPASTQWTHPAQSGTIDLPPLKLRRLKSLSGTVVNRQGQPVSNVTVIQSGDSPTRLETVTDRQGHFVLNNVPEGKLIVGFEATGYRFYGTVLTVPAENVRIEIELAGDPHPRSLKRVAHAAHELSKEQRFAAQKKLVEPIIVQVLAKSLINEADQQMLVAVARLEPERILARLNALKFVRPDGQQAVRNSANFALTNKGMAAATLDTADKIADPQQRLNAYLYWYRANPKRNVAAHRSALAKVRPMIAALKQPVEREFRLCEVATQLCDLGDQDAAREVFRECQKLVEEIPSSNRGAYAARVNLAVGLARVNLDEAKKLATDFEPAQMLRLASEIARQRPREAESFLADVPSELSLMQLQGVANNLPELCRRIARQDPAAAERVLLKFARPPQAQSAAESVFGLGGGLFGNLSQDLIEFQVLKVKISCYGLIAEAAVKHDLPSARQALLKAIELVRPLRTGFVHPQTQNYHSPAVLTALLIPIAERIDPALANEVFWRALSLRVGMTGESQDRQMADLDTCNLVDIISFYDEPLASELLEPVLARTVSRSYSGMPSSRWAIRSLTILDPERAISFPAGLSDRPTWDGGVARTAMTEFIAIILDNASVWEGDAGRRLQNEMVLVRNDYGIYIEMGDAEN